MKNLSKDIELAINIIIKGLEYDIDIDSMDADKIKASMEAKTTSFSNAKKMLNDWKNSVNSPSKEKFKNTVEKLMDAGGNSLNTLRNALRSEINYDDLDATKHKIAIQAKSFILSAIRDIDASLTELKIQLESDTLNLDNKEFKTGYAERYAKQEFFPLKNYYNEWYCDKKDAILLDPKGSKGRMITLDGLNIILPKKPDKKEILFSNLPKKEQRWVRKPKPNGLTLENHKEYSEYIYEEFRRRREGIWFMNNGKAEYLTGNHYFALQWCKMEDNGGYMDFLYAQRDMFYFSEACLIDKRCLGECFVKSRRTGFTYQIIDIFLNDITSTTNAVMGMTSKSDSDASKAFSKFSYAFLNLPFFFRPVVKGKEDSKKFLEFAKPSENTKEAKKNKKTNTDDYLNSKIDYQPTKDDAYDGQKMYRYLGDESGKWRKPSDYEAHWGQISPTFERGGFIVGKAFLGSTVGALSKGGSQFKNIYESSDIKKRDKLTKRTPSGLYGYFLPAHKNILLCTDIYGKCWEEKPTEKTECITGGYIDYGSIEYLKAKEKSAKKISDIAYNEQLRAYPRKISDAFRDTAKTAIFNINKIYEQIEYNDNSHIVEAPVRGNFSWKDGNIDKEVVFYPSSNGRFLVSWIPPKELRNNKINKRGVWYPANEHIGAIGVDSYDISGTVDGRGSKAAAHGLTKIHMDIAPVNEFVFEYIARPQTADIMFEDILMACVFYGFPMLAENNKPRLLYHFKDRGYRGFSMNRPDRPFAKLSKSEKEIGGIPNSSEDIKQIHAAAIESYIENHIGVNEDGTFKSMPFNKTLLDWAAFDINNRTKFDASISSGLAIMANQKHLYIKNTKSKKTVINLKRYNNNGLISSVI
tara:strand:+ start:956 stop:3550 length:2595 start_codon:yes stop_codon:yes gene_type:complete